MRSTAGGNRNVHQSQVGLIVRLYVVWAICCCLGTLASCQSNDATGDRASSLTVAIIHTDVHASNWAPSLARRLAAMPKMKVVTHEQVAAAVDTDVITTALTDDGNTALEQIAEQLGCDLVIAVTLRQHPRICVDARVLDVRHHLRTRPLRIAVRGGPGEASRDINDYCERAVGALVDSKHGKSIVAGIDLSNVADLDAGLGPALRRIAEEVALSTPQLLVVESTADPEAPDVGELHLPGVASLSGTVTADPQIEGNVLVEFMLRESGQDQQLRSRESVPVSLVGQEVVRQTVEMLTQSSTEPPRLSTLEQLTQRLTTSAAKAGEDRLYADEAQLADAAALIQPDDTSSRRRAARAYTHLAEQRYPEPPQDKTQFEQQFQDSVRYAKLSLDRLADAISDDNLRGDPPDLPVVDFGRFARHSMFTASNREAVVAYRRRLRNILTSVLEKPGVQPADRDRFAIRSLPYITRSPEFFAESLDDSIAARNRLLAIVDNSPSAEYLYGEILSDGLTEADIETTIVGQWYRTCGDSKNTLLASTARRTSGIEKAEPAASLASDQPAAITAIHFSPITFELTADDRTYPLMHAPLLPVGPDLDLVYGFSRAGGYGTRTICLMREPGKLEPIFTTDNQQNFGRACFDGRHAWVPLTGSSYRLLRVDPNNGSVKEFNSTHGIPEARRVGAYGVPLAPGRVLWIGSQGRTADNTPVQYLMTDTSASDEITIRIIQEQPYQRPADDFRSLATENKSKTYDVTFVLPIGYGDSGTIDELLIGRTRDACLRFNVNTHVAATVGARVPRITGLGNYQQHGNSIYWTARSQLWRVTPDDLDHVTQLVDLPQRGVIFFAGDRVILIGETCWIADNVLGPFRPLPSNLDPFDRLLSHTIQHSAHFGRLLSVSRQSDNRMEVYQLTLKHDENTYLEQLDADNTPH